MLPLMSLFPSADPWLNDEKALTSTTVALPPCLPAAALVGVVPVLPAQALRARAATAATPTALEIRPKRIPPPCFFECGKDRRLRRRPDRPIPPAGMWRVSHEM